MINIEQLQAQLDALSDARSGLRLLEAGCGSSSRFCFGDTVKVIGIDISQKQLIRNQVLSVRIIGNVENFPLPSESFDAIVCWDLLEHLSHPRRALMNFVQAVNKGGIIILKQPNIWSLKGLITKLTPFRLHVFYYRHVVGRCNAGKDDVGPFPTYLRLAISPKALKRFAAKHRMEIIHFESADYRDLDYVQNYRSFYPLYVILRRLTAMLTFGKLGDSDFVIVLRKQVDELNNGRATATHSSSGTYNMRGNAYSLLGNRGG